jgi:hypothetical protein
MSIEKGGFIIPTHGGIKQLGDPEKPAYSVTVWHNCPEAGMMIRLKTGFNSFLIGSAIVTCPKCKATQQVDKIVDEISLASASPAQSSA